MNIFCLSDLHLQRIWVAEALTEGKLAPFIEQIKHLFQMVKVDAVVITGDTVQSDMIRYLNALFRTFIPASMPVIVTLGNHEFWMHSFEDTLETLKQQTVADPDIHYLDLAGGVIIDGINAFISGLNKIKIPDWVPLVGGKGINIPLIKKLRVGLDYVPYDNMPALLHKGEAVLDEEEAKEYRDQKKDSTNSENNQVIYNNTIVVEKLEVREESDIERIAEELYFLQKKEVGV